AQRPRPAHPAGDGGAARTQRSALRVELRARHRRAGRGSAAEVRSPDRRPGRRDRAAAPGRVREHRAHHRLGRRPARAALRPETGPWSGCRAGGTALL
ncbi:MAG: hypothetical protein AVDCRST_MAG66-4457, partial [uncultured Pseudonocardia sp.]